MRGLQKIAVLAEKSPLFKVAEGIAWNACSCLEEVL